MRGMWVNEGNEGCAMWQLEDAKCALCCAVLCCMCNPGSLCAAAINGCGTQNTTCKHVAAAHGLPASTAQQDDTCQSGWPWHHGFHSIAQGPTWREGGGSLSSRCQIRTKGNSAMPV
jgi:hypothetical protein